MDKVTVHLQKTLVHLNAITVDGKGYLQFNEVKDPSSDVYGSLVLGSANNNIIPYSMKKRIVQLYCLKKRCQEEQSLVSIEMDRLISFYQMQSTHISAHVDRLKSASENSEHLYTSGLTNLLLSLKSKYTRNLLFLGDAWKDVKVVTVDGLCPTFIELADRNIMLPSHLVSEDEESTSEYEANDDDEVDSLFEF